MASFGVPFSIFVPGLWRITVAAENMNMHCEKLEKMSFGFLGDCC